jgi:M6 family metalloprotease-like protein
MNKLFYERMRGAGTLGFLVMMVSCFIRTSGAVTLEDFGYNHMQFNGRVQLNGHEARGNRPLLVILVRFGGVALAHDNAYYDDFVFNFFNTNSVNGCYLENSNSRFFWSRASTGVYPGMIGPLDLPMGENRAAFNALAPAGQLGEELFVSNIVYRAMTMTSFSFGDFDANADRTVTTDELGILIISNDRESSGANRSTHNVKPGGTAVAVNVNLAEVSHREGINLIAHEMSHSLGTFDLYGPPDWPVSQNLSLMAARNFSNPAAADGNDIYHLDPWHKMQLGWVEPRIRSLRDGGIEALSAAQNTHPDAPVILYDPLRFDPTGLNEFFIVEYRTRSSPVGSGFDRDVAGNGLVVWHIQQNAAKNPLTITVPEAGPYVGQAGWLWCNKCQGLFYGGAGSTGGPCPEDGGKHRTPPDAYNYMMVSGVTEPSRQTAWRWCQKCMGLFYGPNQAASFCRNTTGGPNHSAAGSDYSLRMDVPSAPGQHEWRWCRKCQGLFYGPNQGDSNCPKDGLLHDGSASSNYAMVRSLYHDSVFAAGAPDLRQGGNIVWATGQTTPNLRWLDGSEMPVRIYVHPFSEGDGSITIEWLRDELDWVDFAYFGFFEFGTFDFPFNTLAEGVTTVPRGGTINLKTGSSSETASVTKRVRLQAYGGPVTIGR